MTENGHWGPGKTFWVAPKEAPKGHWGPGQMFWVEDEA